MHSEFIPQLQYVVLVMYLILFPLSLFNKVHAFL